MFFGGGQKGTLQYNIDKEIHRRIQYNERVGDIWNVV